MIDLLERCISNYNTTPCCHAQPHFCSCSECLRQDFHERADTYNCKKKLNYYVKNYGPSFASELFHYLAISQLLETNFIGQKINILSIGCGFAPDLLAVHRYIAANNLNVGYKYVGYDVNNAWETARFTTDHSHFLITDVNSGYFDFKPYHIIFIVKLFSTLVKNNIYRQFLELLNYSITNTMNQNAFLIFNDINSIKMGRDIFHRNACNLLKYKRLYYYGQPPYHGDDWIHIPSQEICFHTPCMSTHLPEIRKNITFEYRK